jgi:hypothetical protein
VSDFKFITETDFFTSNFMLKEIAYQLKRIADRLDEKY